MNTEKKVKEAFDLAAERFAAVNVDVNSALEKLQKISLSLHCWQARDGIRESGRLAFGRHTGDR